MPVHQFDTIFEFLRNNPKAGEAEIKKQFPNLDQEIVREAYIREGRSLINKKENKNTEKQNIS